LAASEQPTTRGLLLGAYAEAGTIVLVIGGSIERAEIPGLCKLVHILLKGSRSRAIVCDVGDLNSPDAVAVDALARLQLVARRAGGRVSLRDTHADLNELLALTGLDDVVRRARLPLEMSGKTEEREEARRVEEESDPGDPAI
jgi:anti-anti-sigma factor